MGWDCRSTIASRLLEPYVTTKGHKGTGLGLAIVQKITEQHGGSLALEDAPRRPGDRTALSSALPCRSALGAAAGSLQNGKIGDGVPAAASQ